MRDAGGMGLLGRLYLRVTTLPLRVVSGKLYALPQIRRFSVYYRAILLNLNGRQTYPNPYP